MGAPESAEAPSTRAGPGRWTTVLRSRVGYIPGRSRCVRGVCFKRKRKRKRRHYIAPPEHVYHEPDLIYLTRAYQLILYLEAFGHPDFVHSDISTTAQQVALTYPITQPTVYDKYLDAFLGRVPDH